MRKFLRVAWPIILIVFMFATALSGLYCFFGAMYGVSQVWSGVEPFDGIRFLAISILVGGGVLMYYITYGLNKLLKRALLLD